MSQPVPPSSGNPFAGGDQFAPAPPPAPVRNNFGLGLAAGLGAAVVGALAYGGVMRALASEDGSYTEIGYAALAVGALVGFALGKVGGRNPILPFIGVPLALVAVFFGQLFGFALMIRGRARPDDRHRDPDVEPRRPDRRLEGRGGGHDLRLPRHLGLRGLRRHQEGRGLTP
jgi:hypothetical protein